MNNSVDTNNQEMVLRPNLLQTAAAAATAASHDFAARNDDSDDNASVEGPIRARNPRLNTMDEASNSESNSNKLANRAIAQPK